jgi:hypothetical protein
MPEDWICNIKVRVLESPILDRASFKREPLFQQNGTPFPSSSSPGFSY